MGGERYVGVTGFGNAAEVRAALRDAPPGPRLMVGVLASDKTLTGEPRGRPHRYPRLDDLAGIFVEDRRCLNLVHYATRTPHLLVAETMMLARAAGPRLHGFQLNACWPRVGSVRHISDLGYRVVLQIGSAALREADTPERLAARVAQYRDADAIDAILLDGSGGRGEPLSAAALRPLLRALDGMGVGLGVAGGLPDSLAEYTDLLAEFPRLSCDAEGRLRDADDRLDPARVSAYLRALTPEAPDAR